MAVVPDAPATGQGGEHVVGGDLLDADGVALAGQRHQHAVLGKELRLHGQVGFVMASSAPHVVS